MYFQDLSKYVYLPEHSSPNMLNIGWIDKKHYYPQGSVSEEFLSKLFVLCKNPKNKTRGFYQCPLCERVPQFGLNIKRAGVEIYLGSAEIHVIAENGIIYVAPDLIFHFIRDHNYLPPTEFINAVLASNK